MIISILTQPKLLHLFRYEIQAIQLDQNPSKTNHCGKSITKLIQGLENIDIKCKNRWVSLRHNGLHHLKAGKSHVLISSLTLTIFGKGR